MAILDITGPPLATNCLERLGQDKFLTIADSPDTLDFGQLLDIDFPDTPWSPEQKNRKTFIGLTRPGQDRDKLF